MQPYVTKENVSHMPTAAHKKPKSVTQLSKQSVSNSQVGRVCVSIVMQSNLAAVFCERIEGGKCFPNVCRGLQTDALNALCN